MPLGYYCIILSFTAPDLPRMQHPPLIEYPERSNDGLGCSKSSHQATTVACAPHFCLSSCYKFVSKTGNSTFLCYFKANQYGIYMNNYNVLS